MRRALPGVIPVEVWDLPVGGQLLQAWRDHPAFVDRLAEVARAICAEPPAAWSARARAAARAIERVHLVGGGVDDAAVRAIARDLPCTRSRDPFAAARAGQALLPDALCADIGQTGIKLACGARTWRVARDRDRAPLRDGVPPADRPAARASTLAFLGEVLAGHAAQVLVGLPCELTDDGLPRSCTYCWPDPDPDLGPDLARRAHAAIELVNDAELAALAARAVLPPGPTTLVLTIGFGVGGAILEG